MQRVLSVNFPNWSIDLLDRRLRRARVQSANAARTEPARRRRATLLTETVGGRQLVAACCPVARRAGVCPGVVVAEALALLSATRVRCEPIDPQRDRHALRALAIWARRFSPCVSEDPPDGLLLDIGGCDRVFGGEHRLVDQLTQALRHLGFHVRIGVADTVGCAWAVARFASSSGGPRVPSGEERPALSPLPVAALRIEPDVCQHLFEVNIERIEHLFVLPRNQLFARFGADLLLRMDQATGHAFEPIRPLEMEPLPRVEQAFQGPVKDLTVLFDVVRDLTTQMAQRLQDVQQGVRRLDLWIERSDAPTLRRTLMLTRPSVDACHLFALLRPKVEAANLGFGVERLSLTASKVATLRHRQRPVFAGAVAEGDASVDEGALNPEMGELLDVLVDRCGHERVLRAEYVESHVPEFSLRTRSVLEPPSPTHAALPPVEARDRPSVLFAKPEPIEMIVVRTDGSPVWMRWRGTESRVMHAEGPERIGAPWWKSKKGKATQNLAHRDYYKVQDDRGRWFWIFHGTDSRRWFVHGEYA